MRLLQVITLLCMGAVLGRVTNGNPERVDASTERVDASTDAGDLLRAVPSTYSSDSLSEYSDAESQYQSMPEIPLNALDFWFFLETVKKYLEGENSGGDVVIQTPYKHAVFQIEDGRFVFAISKTSMNVMGDRPPYELKRMSPYAHLSYDDYFSFLGTTADWKDLKEVLKKINLTVYELVVFESDPLTAVFENKEQIYNIWSDWERQQELLKLKKDISVDIDNLVNKFTSGTGEQVQIITKEIGNLRAFIGSRVRRGRHNSVWIGFEVTRKYKYPILGPFSSCFSEDLFDIDLRSGYIVFDSEGRNLIKSVSFRLEPNNVTLANLRDKLNMLVSQTDGYAER